MDLAREINEVKQIAALYEKRGQLHHAIKLLEAAFELERGENCVSLQCADTAYQIAELLSETGQLDEAKTYFDIAVDIYRKNTDQAA